MVSYILKEDETADEVYFNDWFEFAKNARKVRMEKELNFINNAEILGYNTILLNLLKNFLNIYSKYIDKLKNLKIDGKFFNKNKNNNLYHPYNYYLELNFLKLKKIKNNNYYKNSENIIFIIDMRFSKSRIFLINKDKCLFGITSGLIYKKLNLKQKKIKKTEKMLNLMLKSAVMKAQKTINFKKCIIHLKGTKSNIFNILVLIQKNLAKKQISFLYSPYISYGRFKFKKIKSIKKRLRKKFSRLIKN